ncbi:MAG: HAMP domain-containing protein [Prevotella sp.]|nr:HAMP domain-containing protein [Prevotella sp.]
MTFLQTIRQSLSIRLMLWVSGIIITISALVVGLLAQFSKDVILGETTDMTMQVLENTALRIDNTLRLTVMAARLEHQPTTVDRAVIARYIREEGILTKIRQTLPGATLTVEEVKHTAALQSARRDCRLTTVGGRECYTFRHPLHYGAYSLVVVCPATDVYAKFARMERAILVRGGLGIALLLAVLYYIIAASLRPLHRLADAAQAIAQGDLDTPIPDARLEDETGRLQNSLSKMQRSLRAYIDVMQRKQTAMSRQNAELNTAYGEVEVYERLRANFLRDMTARMADPVGSLCRRADTICRDYPAMTKAMMTHHQLRIMHDSETITRLLDQLLSDGRSPVPDEHRTVATAVTPSTEKPTKL